VRTEGVVILPPRVRHLLYLSQREKSIRIQALIPVAPIEALNVAIFNGFSGTDEIEFRVIQIRPCLKFPRCKFRSVINRDYLLASFPGLTAAEATAPLSCNQPDEALRSLERISIFCSRSRWGRPFNQQPRARSGRPPDPHGLACQTKPWRSRAPWVNQF